MRTASQASFAMPKSTFHHKFSKSNEAGKVSHFSILSVTNPTGLTFLNWDRKATAGIPERAADGVRKWRTQKPLFDLFAQFP